MQSHDNASSRQFTIAQDNIFLPEYEIFSGIPELLDASVSDSVLSYKDGDWGCAPNDGLTLCIRDNAAILAELRYLKTQVQFMMDPSTEFSTKTISLKAINRLSSTSDGVDGEDGIPIELAISKQAANKTLSSSFISPILLQCGFQAITSASLNILENLIVDRIRVFGKTLASSFDLFGSESCYDVRFSFYILLN